MKPFGRLPLGIIFVAVWIICGILGYGFRNGNAYHRHEGRYYSGTHRMMAVVQAITGPIGLVVIWANDKTKHGLYFGTGKVPEASEEVVLKDNQLVEEVDKSDLTTPMEELLQAQNSRKELIDTWLAQTDGSRIERLKEKGFSYFQNMRQYEYLKLAKRYSESYPKNAFVTEPDVKRICERYELVLGSATSFRGWIPEDNLAEIDAFEVSGEDLTSRTMQVAAPKTMFAANFDIAPDGYNLVLDPIVLQPVQGGYLVVSVWDEVVSIETWPELPITFDPVGNMMAIESGSIVGMGRTNGYLVVSPADTAFEVFNNTIFTNDLQLNSTIVFDTLRVAQ